MFQKFVKNCGSNLSGTGGSIISPSYPNIYGNNNYCEWTITSTTAKSINITIVAFSTEAPHDKLVILDSATCALATPVLSGSAPQITVPQTIATGKKKLTLLFYTDSSVVATGFNLTWKA